MDVLEQGDLIERTPEIEKLLNLYHPYYASHKDNNFFVVLTQSCDLVRRSGTFNARYLSIAPVRPLRSVLKREFEEKLENVGDGKQAYASHRVKNLLEQFLQRLINNNEAPFFYFEERQEFGVFSDMCAMLALSISIKPEHYDTLLSAKKIGITDVFQAKLGWLVGQMYSRVGTPDFERSKVTEKTRDYLDGIAVWVDDVETKQLKELVNQHETTKCSPVDSAVMRQLIKDLPKKKLQVIDAVLNVAAKLGYVEEKGKNRYAFRQALEKDSVLAQLLSK